MKKPDEIKKALECCFTNGEQCGDCPYYPVSCDRELVRDARDYIRQLEAERDELREGLMNAGGCFECLYFDGEVDADNEPPVCKECKGMSNWEWCGLPKEE